MEPGDTRRVTLTLADGGRRSIYRMECQALIARFRLPLFREDAIMIKICSSVATFGLLLALGRAALAHALPTTTSPTAGSTVKAAPHQVVINFTEAIIVRFSSIEVVDANGKRVDKNDAHLGPAGAMQLEADLEPLPAGTYKVIWHATAEDAHKTEGSFDFAVAP